jgi:ParB family chromosome partitioning protein
MSAMKAVDKLRAMAGGNIAESMGRAGAAGAAAPSFRDPAAAGPDPRAGLSRVKAFAIPTDRIAADPNQPRKEFDEDALDRLAASLRERGQLQPIRVRWDTGMSSWVIIAGERRWRAAVRAGLPTVAAVEAAGRLTEDEILEEQLVENALREDLTPVEQANAFRALMDRRGWSTVKLAEALRLNDSTVTRALSLLRLPGAVQERVEAGRLAPSVAYELSKLDDPGAAADLAGRVVAEGMTRAEVVAEVKRAAGRGTGSRGRAKGRGVRKPASRAFRKAAGYTVTFECPRGVDVDGIRAAVAEILARLDAELGGGDQAAA